MEDSPSVFAMSIAIRPKSGNKKHAKYEERLAREVAARYRGEVQSGRFFVRILWFHGRPLLHDDADADNISKPIVDAMRGIVYLDDRMVVKRLVQRVDLTGGIGAVTLRDKGAPAGAIDELLGLIGGAEKDIVYVEVGLLNSEDVALGVID